MTDGTVWRAHYPGVDTPRRGRVLRRSLAGLGAVLLSGCALLGRGSRASPQEAAAQQAEDTRIRSEVEGRIAAEPSLSAARLRVDVHDREVGLFGSVPGMGALRCAATNAELVQGVRLVIDHTELAPGPSQARCMAPRVFRSTASASARPPSR
jgi:hypothetical protein